MRITVRDLMVPAAATARQTETIATARDRLLRSRSTALLVVDADDRPLGVTTDRGFLSAELRGVDDASPVATLPLEAVEALDAETDLTTVLAMIGEGRGRHFAVTEAGRLLGRLNHADLLRWTLHLRNVATVTNTTPAATLTGPHFHRRRERLAPVRKTSRATGSSAGRRVRRLSAS